VFQFETGLKVFLHRDAVDGRKNINGLAVLVEQVLRLDPMAGAVFAFSNRRRNRIRLLLWDRNGFWLLTKRLEQDRFKWPTTAAVCELTTEQLHWLLEGIDLAAIQRHPTRQFQRVG
jgi:transposase